MEPYIAALAPGRPAAPPGDRETLSLRDATAEFAILRLRLDEGLPARWKDHRGLGEALGWAVGSGLAEVVEGEGGPRIRLTVRGRLLSNELFARIV